ncbi:hypothetical protein PHYPSEUDO_014920 [Phytophthora pseudosyringae]|uniref:FLZ-type domain-containing protein n=1 Tax=Phytophthora pseudosyringae TaxID=221518 RepID=A0A8T1V6B2_9STRA|nr:hypothetical protein PHYPSEUDO_014920 [Phytophthora pseudosyringae]
MTQLGSSAGRLDFKCNFDRDHTSTEFRIPHDPTGLQERPGLGEAAGEVLARSYPTTIGRQASATIAIPNSLASSAPSSMSTVRTRPQRIRRHSVNDSGAGRFCSLDCKTNFEYLAQLQEMVCVELLLGVGLASSGLLDDEDDGNCLAEEVN